MLDWSVCDGFSFNVEDMSITWAEDDDNANSDANANNSSSSLSSNNDGNNNDGNRVACVITSRI